NVNEKKAHHGNNKSTQENRVLKGRDVFDEKSHEVFSVTPWAAKGGRMVLCYVQGSGRGKRVLAAAAEDGIAFFLEGFRFRLSLRVLVETVSDLGFKKSAFIAMAELDEIRLLLGQQSNAFQAQMTTLQADLPSTKGLIQAGCYGGATPVDQRLRVVGSNLEGDAAEWFRWMMRNNLITT
ncbi:hypothetical protein Tco_0055309, partial [Tanacetum coccineum]